MRSYFVWFKFIIVFFFTHLIYGQTKIAGQITDEAGNAVDNATVILKDEFQGKTLAFTFSNTEGKYELSQSVYEGIYKLEFSKISFKKAIQEVVVGTDEANELELNIILEDNPFKLGEVVLQTQSPILVKKDTIVYDINRLRGMHDGSLEDVLLNIEGFKILPTGDIEINGKLIRKVLIDGKETSDFGSALLVKSLSADKIDNIEVRFDEKDAKIRESLLDDNKFVVLDISLKDDFNKSIFGKQQLRIGEGSNTKFGGLTNLFSLNKKINLQFFAELDHFGKNEIELKHIHNIGAEAFNKMISTPVDIDDIKERSGYQEGIYGFDNYIANDKTIAGLSVNFPLSEKTDLYFGSFNDYRFLQNSYSRDLYFESQFVNSYQELNQDRGLNSKNKLQLKHTSDKLKVNSDVNFVYAKQNMQNQVFKGVDTDFKNIQDAKDWYFNTQAEYLLSDKLGISESFSYAHENYTIAPWLKTENAEILDYFNLPFSEFVNQHYKTKESILNNNLALAYMGGSYGNHSIGYQYTKNTLKNEKESNISDFSIDWNKSTSDTHSLYYIGSVFIGPVYTQLKLQNTSIDFPYETSRKRKSYFEYEATINYDVAMQTNLSLSASKMLSLYPLQKQVAGNLMTGFQNVFIPSERIEPYYNTNLSVTFHKTFNRRGEIVMAYLYGKSDNLDSQYFESGMIIRQAAQLSNRFHLVSTQFEKRFSRIGLTARLTPELVLSSSEFIHDNSLEKSQSYQYLLGLRIGYAISDKINFSYSPKYSYFVFENSMQNSTNRYFDFLTNYFAVDTYLLDSALKLSLDYKQVDFMKTKNDFNSFNFRGVYKAEKFRYFIELNNILNSRNFITEDLNHTMLNVNNNRVFGRFINFGVEVKIN